MLRTTVTVVVLALSLAACKKQAPVEPMGPVEITESRPSSRVPDQVVKQLRENFTRVHFGYDSSTLDAGSKAALAANAKLLQQHPGITVEVQGHCDERGTVDYNVALGNRRAEAVRGYLAQLGVSPSRLVAISYGKERPIAAGSSEVAWSQNRRAEFRILTGSADAVVGTIE